MAGRVMPLLDAFGGTSATVPEGSSSFQKVGGRLSLPPATPNPYASQPWDAPAPPIQQAPSQIYQGPATPSYGIGTPDSGGYGGGGIPQAQSRPVMSNDDWLAGDSDYQNQLSQYSTALSDFLSRLATQRNDFKADYDVAKAGLERNAQQGLQNIGEDFTSRGLANSGLFTDSRKKAQQGFEDQRTGMTTARDRALADFSRQEQDKNSSTQMAKDNAMRASLGRMSQQQMF